MSQDSNFTNEGFINFNISSTNNGPALAAALVVEMILGTIINLFIIIASCVHTKTLKKSSTILLLFLAIANLFFCIVYMPFQIITAASHEWIFGNTVEVREGFCVFVGYILSFSIMLMYYILGVISFDRFLMIVKPITHHTIMTPFVVIVIVIVILGLIALYAALPLFGVAVIAFLPDLFTCSVSLVERNIIYVIVNLVVAPIPIIIIIVTSVWTFLFTRNFIKSDYQQRMQSIRNKDAEDYQRNIYNRRLTKLIGIFGMLLIVNTISIVPMVTIGIIAKFVGFHNIPDPIYGIVLVIFFLNNISNPIIQCFFRPELKKTITNFVKYIIATVNVVCKCNKLICRRQNKEEKYITDGSSIPESSTTIEKTMTTSFEIND